MAAVMKMLAVADERDDRLTPERLRQIAPDLIVSCGDLGPDYLDFLSSTTRAQLLYVPGNHDPDERQRKRASGLITNLPPEPDGENLDRVVVTVRGLRFAGFGGSVRYRPGPNRHSQREMKRRVDRMIWKERLRGAGTAQPLDVFVTHAPPLDAGDAPDPAHRGFAAFRKVIEVFRPELMLHGHIHPHGFARPDRKIASTTIINVIPHRVLHIA